MALGTKASDKPAELQGDILAVLLSTSRFNEFDPNFWFSLQELPNAHGHETYDSNARDFLGVAFPTLGRYHRGRELKELVNGHQWLANFTSPSQFAKHEMAQSFHEDPARNLTILSVFAKLQFLKIFGTALIQSDPVCCIYYEIYKIIDAERRGCAIDYQHTEDSSTTIQLDKELVEAQLNKEDGRSIMLPEFEVHWENFLKE